jgi:hypothetical protein
MLVLIFLPVGSMRGAFTRSLDVDEAGAGIAVKNTAHSIIVLIREYGVITRRISMADVVERNRDSPRRNIVAAGTVAIALRDGRSKLD